MKFFAVAVALALWGNAAEAGLYNPAEPWENMLHPRPGIATNPQPLEFFSTFLRKFEQLRAIPVDGLTEDLVHMRYAVVADLSPRLVPSNWSTSRKISLSGYLIRRAKHGMAIELLYPLFNRERSNFLVSANLATAYQHDKQERRAVDYFEQTISAWPRAWTDLSKDMKKFLEQIGWNEETFLWYREAEIYHLKLARLRAREAIKAATPETLDNLFDVDFKYEGDKLPEKEKAKIPSNALAVVQQLLIWLPEDPRLYWLLGELYHARGTPEDEAAARQIFNDLAGFNGRYRVDGTKNHLHALGPARPVQPNLEPVESPTVPPPSDDGAVFDLRPLLIGFGAGVAVSFLAYWQIRELRRRAHKPPTNGERGA